MKLLLSFFQLALFIKEINSESFCTSNNLRRLCGVSVIEFNIDNAKIDPSNKCKKIFFWIPPFSQAGEEKCYICGEEENIADLRTLVNSKNKRCGKFIPAGKL